MLRWRIFTFGTVSLSDCWRHYKSNKIYHTSLNNSKTTLSFRSLFSRSVCYARRMILVSPMVSSSFIWLSCLMLCTEISPVAIHNMIWSSSFPSDCRQSFFLKSLEQALSGFSNNQTTGCFTNVYLCVTLQATLILLVPTPWIQPASVKTCINLLVHRGSCCLSTNAGCILKGKNRDTHRDSPKFYPPLFLLSSCSIFGKAWKTILVFFSISPGTCQTTAVMASVPEKHKQNNTAVFLHS